MIELRKQILEIISMKVSNNYQQRLQSYRTMNNWKKILETEK